MVKQAEKKRNRSPFLPVLGLFLAIVLLVAAYGASDLIYQSSRQVRDALKTLAMVNFLGKPTNQGVIMLAFVFWLIFLALAYFVVAVAAGKDPESTKDIPMPPRGREKIKPPK